MSRTDRHRSRTDRRSSRRERLHPLAALLAAGLIAPVFAGPSKEFPKYVAGPGPSGKYVLGNGQIVSPAGARITLGSQVRAKAIAINPTDGHTASVLLMGASEAVEVFDTKPGAILQQYSSSGGTDSSGSYGGIAYSADGKYLVFSQDSSNIAVAQVTPTGLVDFAHVSVPPDNSFITCFPNSPIGDYGRSCGTF